MQFGSHCLSGRRKTGRTPMLASSVRTAMLFQTLAESTMRSPQCGVHNAESTMQIASKARRHHEAPLSCSIRFGKPY